MSRLQARRDLAGGPRANRDACPALSAHHHRLSLPPLPAHASHARHASHASNASKIAPSVASANQPARRSTSTRGRAWRASSRPSSARLGSCRWLQAPAVPPPSATLTGRKPRPVEFTHAAPGASGFIASKPSARTWRYCRSHPNEQRGLVDCVFVLPLSRYDSRERLCRGTWAA